MPTLKRKRDNEHGMEPINPFSTRKIRLWDGQRVNLQLHRLAPTHEMVNDAVGAKCEPLHSRAILTVSPKGPRGGF